MVGLRERKREIARREIVDAAFSLFSAHGFDGTTVDMIAEQAVVSPRTVYRYFDSKEAIVFVGVEGRADEIAATVRRHCADGVSVSALFAALAEQLGARQNEPAYRTLTALVLDNPPLIPPALEWRREATRRVAEVLGELRGELEPSLEDEALAGMVMSVSAVAVAQWAADDHRDDLGELVLRAGRAVINAAQA